MYKNKVEYQMLAIVSLVQTLNAASIHLTSALPSITSTSSKPSTLLLPPGFDSQLPPRQPMLYPFVVSTTKTPTTAAVVIKKSLGPFITPGWIPISSSSINLNKYKETITLAPLVANIPTSYAPKPQTHPVPILEDRASKYVLNSNDNGPVFESIVYGTWKPDPPLQPVEMLNATTTTYNINSKRNNTSSSRTISSSTTISVSAISNSDNTRRSGGHDSSSEIDGKVSNKTINRQHGGFIDNKQQKIIKFENQSSPRDSHDMAAFAQRPIESTSLDNGNKAKQRKFVKKQGRQKIRPNTTTATKLTKTTFEMTTTPIESTAEQSTTVSDAVKLKTVLPAEVVRQINDSIEIKYNHKQNSKHSIEVTAHERYKNHRFDNFDDDDLNDHDDNNDGEEIDIVTAPTTMSDVEQQGIVIDDDDDDDGGSSVIRMNWPTDFMNTPHLSSTSTEPEVSKTKPQTTMSSHMETASAELPLALSSLNIPQSLWPRFPGNITKLGAPYTAQSSLEEPALCVPITVREHNMMNSHEIVNIERVFCFPMPSTKMPRGFTKAISSSTEKTVNGIRRSTEIPTNKENIQNFKDFYEPDIRNTSNYLYFNTHLVLVCYALVIYLTNVY